MDLVCIKSGSLEITEPTIAILLGMVDEGIMSPDLTMGGRYSSEQTAIVLHCIPYETTPNVVAIVVATDGTRRAFYLTPYDFIVVSPAPSVDEGDML